MNAVLEEHIDYLTLPGRQALFERAIAKVVKPGMVVADLGCGVGVLGLTALKAGAARAYGIDYSDAIELARESMARAGLADRYTCIRGSTYLTSLPEPVDLIICDHVGYFGFDYGIVGMLDDARQRMLRPGGQIMPRRLRLFVAGAQSAKARCQIDPWTVDPMPQDFRWLHEYAVNSKQSHDFTAQEIVTEPQLLGEIDLTVTTPDSIAFSASLQALDACRIDGLACWFEAELAEGIWMTNSPLAPQSIRRCNAFLAARDPFALAKGDGIDLTIRIRPDDHLITWTIQPIGGARQKLSTWAGQILQPADLAPNSAGPLTLNDKGLARKLVLSLVDGVRTGAQIEEAVLQAHPDLFPTAQATCRFVRGLLASDAAA